MAKSRASVRPWLTIAAALILILVAFAPGASAQQGPPDPDDPPPHGPPDCAGYPGGCGSTTTTTQPDGGPTCGVAAEAVVAGDQVTVTVHKVPAGGTVRVIVNGDEVARGTNDSAVQSIRAMPAQTADVVMTFQVPNLAPGDYPIHAVGDTFTVTCGGGVLSIKGSGSGGGGGGGLAFTGSSVLGLIALALALLAVGYYLVRRSRRRDAGLA